MLLETNDPFLFTINTECIQNIINSVDKNDLVSTLLNKGFNELIENERAEYL